MQPEWKYQKIRKLENNLFKRKETKRDDVIELITNIMKIGKQENKSKQNKSM